MQEWPLLVLFACPGLLGVLALTGGIALLTSSGKQQGSSTIATIAGVVLLVVALGIGACYGVVFLPSVFSGRL